MKVVSTKHRGSQDSKRPVPFTQETENLKGKGFHYNGQEFVHHTDLSFADSAFSQLTTLQKFILLLLIFTIGWGIATSWHLTIIVLVTLVTLLYFTDLLFNLFLVYRSYFREAEISVKNEEIDSVNAREWPIYTILCPLYKESEVLPQFVKAISSLEYPKDKLQVLLLLEEDDKETLRAAKKMNLPSYFETITVPFSMPKTKPKACNYGLNYAKGEYVVVYDAEDVPESLQLKKAVLAFEKCGSKVICIQAKLNFYNSDQNLLTRLFTLEYSLWFDLVLTGLQSINAPIPLGGTSNHFRKKDLLWLKKWDPFNVTEDADLGMRIVKRGYKTAVINSTTMEEANSHLGNWFRQRSRWIKGYIQTYFVHMRKPHEFLQNDMKSHLVTFQLVVGGKVLSMLINPILWIMTICYFVFREYIGTFVESLYLTPIFYIGAFSLVAGNFLYMYYYMMGAAKRGHWELVPYALLTPFYWLAMSAAAFFALFEFIVKPHYWHKTKHGLHLSTKEEEEFLLPNLIPSV